jgi:hypothetical protein
MKNIKKFKAFFEDVDSELIFTPDKKACNCANGCDCGDDCQCGDDCDCPDCNGKTVHNEEGEVK